MEINLPEVLAEVTAQCARYERVLVDNHVDELDVLFWNMPHTVRYGATENLYGHAEIQAFRAARSPGALERRILRHVITTYGRDMATSSLEFARDDSDRIGRQSQTWMRTTEGWRVVAAHVSLMA